MTTEFMSSWSKKYVVIITDKYWPICNHKFLLIKNKPEPDTSSVIYIGISYAHLYKLSPSHLEWQSGKEYTEQSSWQNFIGMTNIFLAH